MKAKKMLAFVMLFSMALMLTSCTAFKTYKISYEGDLILHESYTPKTTAKAGEEVEIRVGLVHDVNTLVYVNGEEIPRIESDSWKDSYLEYKFVMPSKDVKLEIKLEDIQIPEE